MLHLKIYFNFLSYKISTYYLCFTFNNANINFTILQVCTFMKVTIQKESLSDIIFLNIAEYILSENQNNEHKKKKIDGLDQILLFLNLTILPINLLKY